MKPKPIDLPSAEFVRSVLDYDQNTGAFTWKKSRGGWGAGVPAGCIHPSGYTVIRLNYRSYLAHRLAWLHFYGADPLGSEVDHVDCVKSNNAIANLRLASQSQQQHNKPIQSNNKSGLKGVCRISAPPGRKEWRASICVNGRNIYLGTFYTAEEARAVYTKAAADLHGEFARTA